MENLRGGGGSSSSPPVSGFIAVALIVVVVHGFITKLWEWYTGKDQDGSSTSNVPFDKTSSNDNEDLEPYNARVYSAEETLKRSKSLFEEMSTRRNVREYSEKEVSREVITNIIKTAGTCASYENNQPWTFVTIKNTQVKDAIQKILEEENKKKSIKSETSHLSKAPYLIVVFKRTYTTLSNNTRKLNKFSDVSVAMATGVLLTGIHNAGLVTSLTTPMGAGAKIRYLLNRNQNEACAFILPIGYPMEDCLVAKEERKEVEEFMVEL